jgi:SAM-dependent methyltransferase
VLSLLYFRQAEKRENYLKTPHRAEAFKTRRPRSRARFRICERNWRLHSYLHDTGLRRGTTLMSVKRESASEPDRDRVLRAEADFANQDYESCRDQLEINPAMFRRYHSPSELWDWRQRSALLLGNIAGKDLLDFGCGMGEESIYFSKLGARVTAIDISDVGITILKRRAAFHRLDIRALEMRADPTSFADASFDRIHGLGILHHIGLESGLQEVARLLRPGGTGVFLEPMGDSPTVEAAKAWLMQHGRFLADFVRVTDYERNLTWSEVERALQRFASATLYPYHLLFRLKRLLPGRVLDAVRRFDASLLARAPQLRRYAGAVVIAVHAADDPDCAEQPEAVSHAGRPS